MIVYDITSRTTFNNCQYWLNEIKNNRESTRDMAITLVGNKTDIVNGNEDLREVSEEEAQVWAQQNHMEFIETSAISHRNVKECFYQLLETIHSLNYQQSNQQNSFQVEDKSMMPPRQQCCYDCN